MSDSRLLAVFDAVAVAGKTPHGNPLCEISFHDYSGAVVKALHAWASAYGHDIERRELDLPERIWDLYRVRTSNGGTISVHDETSRRINAREVSK